MGDLSYDDCGEATVLPIKSQKFKFNVMSINYMIIRKGHSYSLYSEDKDVEGNNFWMLESVEAEGILEVLLQSDNIKFNCEIGP